MKQNNNQLQAIQHMDGPCICIAGPGSGKTYIITNRVKYLIEKCQVEPEKILVVTFSKAAAVEMSTRFQSLMNGKRIGVRFGTFHSVFFQVLRAAYNYDAKDIVSSALKYRFIDEAISDTDYEIEDKNEFIEEIEKEISKIKGEGIDIDCYYSTNCPEEVFRKIYKGYQGRLQRHRALDFDDMVIYTYELFKAREDILASWQRRYKYILVDEFQDINRLQYENICMMAQPENNLFIVGDDDQSIYGFRGARPDIMLSFPDKFKDAKKITLNDNYRSGAEILSAAGRLISHNKKRFNKEINSKVGKLEGVHIRRYQNLSNESDKILEQIQKFKKEKIQYQDMAVLFRTNMQMRSLASRLMEHAIPFVMKETLPNIFNSWMAKDIINYVELALGDRSRSKVLKICNRPLRYFSRAAFDNEVVDFRDVKEFYRKKGQFWMLERVDEFQNQLNVIKSLSPYSALNYIRKGIGYDEFLGEFARDKGVKPDDWFEVLDEIADTSKDCNSLSEWLAYVDGYGELLEEIQKENKKKQDQQKGVNLMTMHGAKGLEFEAVFIPTINESVIPYRKSIQMGGIEEERRLLYVGMTRAKKYLYMSFVDQRFNKSVDPSRFLGEVSPKFVKAYNENQV